MLSGRIAPLATIIFELEIGLRRMIAAVRAIFTRLVLSAVVTLHGMLFESATAPLLSLDLAATIAAFSTAALLGVRIAAATAITSTVATTASAMAAAGIS